MDWLIEHVQQDKYRYDHHWKDGDVVISEQWLTIHKRHEFDNMSNRVLHRIAFDYEQFKYERHR
jgi:taurine dioxygenase